MHKYKQKIFSHVFEKPGTTIDGTHSRCNVRELIYYKRQPKSFVTFIKINLPGSFSYKERETRKCFEANCLLNRKQKINFLKSQALELNKKTLVTSFLKLTFEEIKKFN